MEIKMRLSIHDDLLPTKGQDPKRMPLYFTIDSEGNVTFEVGDALTGSQYTDEEYTNIKVWEAEF